MDKEERSTRREEVTLSANSKDRDVEKYLRNLSEANSPSSRASGSLP
jgi:hypothetical protein